MKKLFLVSLLVIAFSAHSAHSLCEDKFPFSIPDLYGDYSYLCRTGYATIHDNGKKIPFASFEHLTPATIGRNNVKRKNSFREDKDLPVYARAKPKDYSKVGKTFDKGHLANAQNASSTDAMFDTFLMSNIIPQVGAFNRGQWKRLETNVAKKVRNGRELYVITGAVPGRTPYNIIGNGVVVPSAMFKIIIDKTSNEAIAYLMPNEVNNNSYKTYTITINDLTKVLNADLVPTAVGKIRDDINPSLK